MGNVLTESIIDQTNRALWEVWNVIDCVPKELWCRKYCEMPLYDKAFQEPGIHILNFNNLDVKT